MSATPPAEPAALPDAPSTAGMAVQARSRWVRDAVELVSSMRFAISLLTVICIASIIGTVVKQNEPALNYVNQFGPFWAEAFRAVGADSVYSVWWFLLILAVLVLSTSLCIARNTPKIFSDLKTMKEGVREQSLMAFHHKARGTVAEDAATAATRIAGLLSSQGWKLKAQGRASGTMLAARKGSANKIGYLAAHSSIVLICLGGLFDGDLVVRAQMAWQGKTPYGGGGMISDVPEQHRLSANNPTFRANLLVPEGARANTAIITMGDSVVLQALPFDVELKKFKVDYYETGMPKLFASDVVLHDRDTGVSTARTIKVNEPAVHRGIAIFQSSFDDGGSRLSLRAQPLTLASKPFDLKTTVGDKTALQSTNGEKLTLELSGLRVINVENLGANGPGADGASATDVRKVDLMRSLDTHLGSGAKGGKAKTQRNVGPSVSYRLRDAAGQAREYHNYMLPMDLDGQRVFLVGVRESTAEALRYLRIPVDENDGIEGWLALRRALSDPALRESAARRYVAAAAPRDNPKMAEQLLPTTLRTINMFAGAEKPSSNPAKADVPPGGLQAIAEFLETSVPAHDRERISEVLLRILNGTLVELDTLGRQQVGMAPRTVAAANEKFMPQAVIALSDSLFYPAPFIVQLRDFEQVQASVFQVARAPGRNLVYLGAVLLIVGVFAMLYVRERRLWVWIEADAQTPTASRVTTAMSTTRRTLDLDAEFDRLQHWILQRPTP